RATAGALGLTVAETVFPPGAPSALVDDLPGGDGGDVLLVAGRFEDEVELAGVLLGEGRWRAAGFVGAGTDEVLASIDESRRDGLLGPAQWVASAAPAAPADGPDADWFVAG